MTRKELKITAKQQLSNNWLKAILIIVIAFLITGLSSYLSDIYYGGIWTYILMSIVTFSIATPLELGQSIFFLNLSKNKEGKISDLFLGYKSFIKVIGVGILINIIVSIGLILFIIPGLILSIMYSQSYYILAENPNIRIVECLRESRLIMNGQKWNYLVLMMSFILWILLTVITFGIAGLYVIPYYELTFTNFYLDIKNLKLDNLID